MSTVLLDNFRENPYVALVARKHRNLKKKLFRIEKIEAQLQEGRELDSEQIVLLNSRKGIEKTIADLSALQIQLEEIAVEERKSENAKKSISSNSAEEATPSQSKPAGASTSQTGKLEKAESRKSATAVGTVTPKAKTVGNPKPSDATNNGSGTEESKGSDGGRVKANGITKHALASSKGTSSGAESSADKEDFSSAAFPLVDVTLPVAASSIAATASTATTVAVDRLPSDTASSYTKSDDTTTAGATVGDATESKRKSRSERRRGKPEVVKGSMTEKDINESEKAAASDIFAEYVYVGIADTVSTGVGDSAAASTALTAAATPAAKSSTSAGDSTSPPKEVTPPVSPAVSRFEDQVEPHLRTLLHALLLCQRYQSATGKKLPPNVDYFGKSLLGQTSISGYQDTLNSCLKNSRLFLQESDSEAVRGCTYKRMRLWINDLASELMPGNGANSTEKSAHAQTVKPPPPASSASAGATACSMVIGSEADRASASAASATPAIAATPVSLEEVATAVAVEGGSAEKSNGAKQTSRRSRHSRKKLMAAVGAGATTTTTTTTAAAAAAGSATTEAARIVIKNDAGGGAPGAVSSENVLSTSLAAAQHDAYSKASLVDAAPISGASTAPVIPAATVMTETLKSAEPPSNTTAFSTAMPDIEINFFPGSSFGTQPLPAVNPAHTPGSVSDGVSTSPKPVDSPLPTVIQQEQQQQQLELRQQRHHSSYHDPYSEAYSAHPGPYAHHLPAPAGPGFVDFGARPGDYNPLYPYPPLPPHQLHQQHQQHLNQHAVPPHLLPPYGSIGPHQSTSDRTVTGTTGPATSAVGRGAGVDATVGAGTEVGIGAGMEIRDGYASAIGPYVTAGESFGPHNRAPLVGPPSPGFDGPFQHGPHGYFMPPPHYQHQQPEQQHQQRQTSPQPLHQPLQHPPQQRRVEAEQVEKPLPLLNGTNPAGVPGVVHPKISALKQSVTPPYRHASPTNPIPITPSAVANATSAALDPVAVNITTTASTAAPATTTAAPTTAAPTTVAPTTAAPTTSAPTTAAPALTAATASGSAELGRAVAELRGSTKASGRASRGGGKGNREASTTAAAAAATARDSASGPSGDRVAKGTPLKQQQSAGTQVDKAATNPKEVVEKRRRNRRDRRESSALYNSTAPPPAAAGTTTAAMKATAPSSTVVTSSTTGVNNRGQGDIQRTKSGDQVMRSKGCNPSASSVPVPASVPTTGADIAIKKATTVPSSAAKLPQSRRGEKRLIEGSSSTVGAGTVSGGGDDVGGGVAKQLAEAGPKQQQQQQKQASARSGGQDQRGGGQYGARAGPASSAGFARQPAPADPAGTVPTPARDSSRQQSSKPKKDIRPSNAKSSVATTAPTGKQQGGGGGVTAATGVVAGRNEATGSSTVTKQDTASSKRSRSGKGRGQDKAEPAAISSPSAPTATPATPATSTAAAAAPSVAMASSLSPSTAAVTRRNDGKKGANDRHAPGDSRQAVETVGTHAPTSATIAANLMPTTATVTAVTTGAVSQQRSQRRSSRPKPTQPQQQPQQQDQRQLADPPGTRFKSRTPQTKPKIHPSAAPVIVSAAQLTAADDAGFKPVITKRQLKLATAAAAAPPPAATASTRSRVRGGGGGGPTKR